MNTRWDSFYENARKQHGLSPDQARHGLTHAVRHAVRQASRGAVGAAGISRTEYLSTLFTTDRFHVLYLYTALHCAGRAAEANLMWRKHLRQEVVTAAEALAAVPATAPFGNAEVLFSLMTPCGLTGEQADRVVLRAAYHLSLGYPFRSHHMRDLTLADLLAHTTVEELRPMIGHAALVEAQRPGELHLLLKS
ncbi:hypothetical protein OHS70_34380 [Streptomyces sp. NBC_00390]|uniref:hypothetical protein n=1 Tax=Streptomyces sp. NBC_00390 TaxID=2975736 RepID=UPI002E1F7B57